MLSAFHRTLLVASFAVAACGDNSTATLATCPDLADPVPTGLLSTIADMPTLEGCTPGGIGEFASTIWFVPSAKANAFAYAYPRIENSCAAGLTFNDYPYSWSDGTIGFGRFGFEDKFASAAVFCFRDDGTLVYAARSCRTAQGTTECRDRTAGVGQAYPVLGDAARNVALIGDDTFASGAYDVDVKGTVAYVATDDGIRAYDLSNPNALSLAGTLDLSTQFSINDIEVWVAGSQRFAYVSADNTIVADVSDPAAMQAVGLLDVSGRDGYSHTLQIGERAGVPHLYLGGQQGIPVYSLATPRTPSFVDTIPLSMPGTHDMTVSGNTIYVNNEFGGFVNVDTTSLTAPVEGTRFNGDYYDHASAVGMAGNRRLVVEGGEGLEPDSTGARMRIFDGDPSSASYMKQVGSYATRAQTGIHNMILRDGFVYIAYYHDGLRVVDVRNPVAPVEVAHYNSWARETSDGGAFQGAIGIDLADDGTVILVNYEGRVMRLRVTLPM
jgi:hypothetical protein